MRNYQIRVLMGGGAKLGRLIGESGSTRTLCYETDLIVKIKLLTEGYESRFRGFIGGLDKIDENGETVEGFGSFQLEDINTSDFIYGNNKWYRKDDEDRGQIFFTSGTGRWKGIKGGSDVVLDYCLINSENEKKQRNGDYAKGVVIIQGDGSITLP